MTDKRTEPIQRDWISKTLAGMVLGATMALGCSGLFSQLSANNIPFSVRGQLAMWMVPPIWLGVLSGSYFFANGLRAWLWLGGASALIVAVLLALRLS